jgi:hypothetical protein
MSSRSFFGGPDPFAAHEEMARQMSQRMERMMGDVFGGDPFGSLLARGPLRQARCALRLSEFSRVRGRASTTADPPPAARRRRAAAPLRRPARACAAAHRRERAHPPSAGPADAGD